MTMKKVDVYRLGANGVKTGLHAKMVKSICSICFGAFPVAEIRMSPAGKCAGCGRTYEREKSRRRRAVKGTTSSRGYGTAWQRLSKAVLARDGQVCRYCGGKATTTDHLIPKSKGGTDAMSNLVACCQPCNSGKKDRLFSDRV